MSNPLQIALFAACIAVVLFVMLLIPASFLIFRHVRRTVAQMEEMGKEVRLLIHDSREMIQEVKLLSSRANQQLDELARIVRVVQGWSARANHVVEEVSSAVEAPFIKLARGVKRLRQIWRFLSGGFVPGDEQADHQTKEGSQAGQARPPAPPGAAKVANL